MNTYQVKYQVSILLWGEYSNRDRTEILKANSAKEALQKIIEKYEIKDNFMQMDFHRLVDISKIE